MTNLTDDETTLSKSQKLNTCAPVTEHHRELAKKCEPGCGCCVPWEDQVESVTQAIADAEARGREQGIRDAAKVSQDADAGWWQEYQTRHYSELEHYSDAAEAVTERILALLETP